MKTAILVLHCANIIGAAAVATGYTYQWIGFIVLATSGLDAYLTSLVNKANS